MDRETEMYHAAIRLLSKKNNNNNNKGAIRDAFYEGAYLIDRHGNRIHSNEVRTMIDDELDALPGSTIAAFIESPKLYKHLGFYQTFDKTKYNQYVANRKLWNSTRERITSNIMRTLANRGVSDLKDNEGAIHSMVEQRMLELYPYAED